jgi:hypothetical protein
MRGLSTVKSTPHPRPLSPEYRGEGSQEFNREAASLGLAPFSRGRDWLDWVNRPQSEAEPAAKRKCIARGTPYGKETWQHVTAERLGLEASLQPRGRPPIIKTK